MEQDIGLSQMVGLEQSIMVLRTLPISSLIQDARYKFHDSSHTNQKQKDWFLTNKGFKIENFHPNNPVFNFVFNLKDEYYTSAIKLFNLSHPEWTDVDGISFKHSLTTLFTDRNNETIKIGDVLLTAYNSKIHYIMIIGRGRDTGPYYLNLTTGYKSFLVNSDSSRFLKVDKNHLNVEEKAIYENWIKQKDMSWLV